MSKHCEVCNRSYPDDRDACPYCAEAREIAEADVVELAEEEIPVGADAIPEDPDAIAAAAFGADSAVDLGLPVAPSDPNAGGSSGASVMEWASLVEEGPTQAEPAAASFDSPSDANRIDHPRPAGVPPAAAEATPAQPASEHEDALGSDLEAVRNIFSGDISSSFARRGPAEPAAPPPPAAGGDDSAIDLLAPDLPADHAETPPPVGHAPEVLEAADSGVDLASADLDAEIVAEAAPADSADSAVDLSGAEAVDEPYSGSSVLHGDDSDIDLTAMEVGDVPPTEPPARPVSDSGIDLSGEEMTAVGPDSGLRAGIEKDTPDTSESGRDLIAEEVESGMNLDRPAAKTAGDSGTGSGIDFVEDEPATALTAGQLPSEEEEIDLSEMPGGVRGPDSSAVDLGGSATFPTAAPQPPSGDDDLESTRPYEAKAKNIHGGEEISPSEVDLSSRHDVDFFEPSEGLAGGPDSAERTADETGAVEAEDEPSPMDEEEPAAVEEEEPAAEEEEEPVRPKKEKRRSTAGAWVGGVLLGGVLTTCVLLGLWLFNIEPPKEWRALVGRGAPVVATAPNVPGPTPPAAAPPSTPADVAAMLRSGDLDRVKQTGLDKVDETKPEEVAARGEYLVRDYLREKFRNQGKGDDAELKKGTDDLEKVKDQDPDALFYLAVAKEADRQWAEAQKIYQEGAERFKDDPVKRDRFEAGVNRMSLKLGEKPGNMSRAEPVLDPTWFALLLVGLEPAQPPEPVVPPPAPGAAALPEAGSKFWEAEKLAQAGDYAKAIQALDEASKRHQDRRFTELGKAQNPESDPTEEIFLRSCEELKAYWQLRQKLHDSTLPVVQGKDAGAAVDALLAEDKALADKAAMPPADTVAKKDLEAAKKDAEAAKTERDAAKKDLETTKTDLEAAKKDLETAKKDLDATKDDLTAAKKELAAVRMKADDLADKAKTAEADAAKKEAALKGVADALAGSKFVQPGASDESVVAAAKELARSADVKEAGRIIGGLKAERDALKAEAADFKAALQERWAPEKMLTIWLPIVRDTDRIDLAGDAIRDADRVLSDDRSTAADKAHAHAIKGMALRDEERYAEAKAELERAKADLPKDDNDWQLETDTALTAASYPSADFVVRAETLRQEGQGPQALALLDRAMETAAEPLKDRLLIMRGRWRLDEALVRGNGRVSEDDLAVVAARKDADAAKAGGGSEAFYLSGRIDEAVGKPAAAAGDYRQALAAHPDADAEGARYRAALARALMRQPHDGDDDPTVKEALKLVGDILAIRDAPFDARAEALAVQGLWTEALTTFVEGLRPRIGPASAARLAGLLQGHPALRQPTVMVVADPLEAAKHYAAGLQFYNDRAFDKAEREFFTAVEHDGQDARYYYFLGLSRLWQGDRDGYEDFEQGARLERRNRPSRAAVSAALERVQGGPREKLNAIRDRPQ